MNLKKRKMHKARNFNLLAMFARKSGDHQLKSEKRTAQKERRYEQAAGL